MQQKLQKFITKASNYLEILLAVILGVALIFLIIVLAYKLYNTDIEKISVSTTLFQKFLGNIMMIAVGIEIIKMFSNPSSKTIIEVLSFAIARQMISGHSSELHFLIGVISIAILFATRKYLLPKN